MNREVRPAKKCIANNTCGLVLYRLCLFVCFFVTIRLFFGLHQQHCVGGGVAGLVGSCRCCLYPLVVFNGDGVWWMPSQSNTCHYYRAIWTSSSIDDCWFFCRTQSRCLDWSGVVCSSLCCWRKWCCCTRQQVGGWLDIHYYCCAVFVIVKAIRDSSQVSRTNSSTKALERKKPVVSAELC